MALTRDFRPTALERAKSEHKFRVGLLTEAAECLLNDEPDVAGVLLCDYVEATIGFQVLAEIMDKKPASLIRLLGNDGNPSLETVSQVLWALRKHEGVHLRVTATQ